MNYISIKTRSQYETVFTIFLLVLAILYRNHPSFIYPQLLYIFIAFLGFNLLYNRFLRQKIINTSLNYSPIFINGVLITWIIQYSGGESSFLWVLYLLPVFTACLLMDSKGIILTTSFVAFLQLLIYKENIWKMDSVALLELLSRLSLLILSAFVTAHLSALEKSAKNLIEAQKKYYQETLKKLKIESSGEDKGDNSNLITKGIHDINAALTVILGGTEIIRSQTNSSWFGLEDMKRMESSVRLSKFILQNLFVIGKGKEWNVEKYSLHALLRESYEQCKTVLLSKKISLATDFRAPHDILFVNRYLIQQALSNLVFYASQSTPLNNKISIKTCLAVSSYTHNKGVEITISYPGSPLEKEEIEKFFDPFAVIPNRGKGMGIGLFTSQEIIIKHGGEIKLIPVHGKGYSILVNLPLEFKSSKIKNLFV